MANFLGAKAAQAIFPEGKKASVPKEHLATIGMRQRLKTKKGKCLSGRKSSIANRIN